MLKKRGEPKMEKLKAIALSLLREKEDDNNE
jgi:hypothetical protein